ncbi:MAG: metallophosphoesterase [Candidatus Saccharimonas sp.]|nr:metallophosphoesterase [Candidatus Saccharimonas sp.]
MIREVPPGVDNLKPSHRWLRRMARGMGVVGLAAIGHIGGFVATKAAPAHVDTGSYTVDVSLDLFPLDQITLPTNAGEARLLFGGKLPTASLRVDTMLTGGSISTYVERGLEGFRPTEPQTGKIIEQTSTQLMTRYGIGVAAAEAIALLIMSASAGNISRKKITAVALAGIVSLGYEVGSSYTTYQSDNYQTLQLTGLLGEIQHGSKFMLDGIDDRVEQLRPYIKSWQSVQKDLENEFTSPTGEELRNGPSFLLVSDIHSLNMYPIVEQIVTQEHAAAVIDSGDLLVAGRVEEAELTGIFDSIAKLSVPYIIVLGNHDKSSRYDKALIDRLSKIDNVIILEPHEGEFNEVRVGELTIAGVNDNERWYGDSNTDNVQKQRSGIDRFNKVFSDYPPDIAVSHEPEASRELVTRGVTIAGHYHKSSVDSGNHITNGTLTGGGIFGYKDSEDPADASPLQSYGLLTFDATCKPRQLRVLEFTGMLSGQIDIVSDSQHYFKHTTSKSTDAPRDCTSIDIRTNNIRINTAP